jgi:hypothetical protein
MDIPISGGLGVLLYAIELLMAVPGVRASPATRDLHHQTLDLRLSVRECVAEVEGEVVE